MTASVGCFTSLSLRGLANARVLAETVRAAHPEWAIYAVLVDEMPPGFDSGTVLDGFDEVVQADQLGIPRFRPWLFKHDVDEACAAVKGQMLVRMLERGFDTVVYLAPETALFHPLAGVGEASVVLTPHQADVNEGGAATGDGELAALRHGAYNLGFLAVRNDDVGRSFAAWWAGRLAAGCYDDVPNGLFHDQKYCDLVPGLFGGVRIERDAGCNVARANLSQRRLRFVDGGVTANGSPLKFATLAGLGEGDAAADGGTELLELARWYSRRVEANQVAGLEDRPWGYGVFSDGQPIPRALRLIYRDRPDLLMAFDDPFDAGTGMRAWAVREGLAAHA